ncbi:hypothetical protein HanPI659440_Chr13g0483491 [Helianthus annuus]|nr:hypothetical protein HanPI659440_Chr13g0483491 [Helianthus annuus]
MNPTPHYPLSLIPSFSLSSDHLPASSTFPRIRTFTERQTHRRLCYRAAKAVCRVGLPPTPYTLKRVLFFFI